MDTLYKTELEKITKGHIFYRFQDEEAYLKNLISFILAGIENKEQILIIENMRNLPKIKDKIDMLISDEQQTSIRLVNNFEYYLSKGDFHTPTILNFFQKDLSALKNLNTSIRTWAHVEWTSSEPDTELLKEFESTADKFVLKEDMLSVCAYSSSHLTSTMNIALEQLHKYVLTDGSLSVSSLYNR
ncbi:MEDS domain-containing protein [Paenisporosarcina macmurdoensis]|uniref:MEDS domain-containing protein n=1 Tax=Paenisporosarcina macmurdoensis TaxID=212659 RepID=A0ABW1L6B3_9BACL